MPLLALWSANPAAVTELTITQIVATAGDGNLKDNSVASEEFRQYLSEVPIERLGTYAEQCLESSFPKSGLALQDVVNELGRRLDYHVENGRYQGISGGIGFDGIWSIPDGRQIVVEVKTTDAYRISLDTIATYRHKLQENGKVGNDTSVLIVVGREDTGELEAQVRGSRHAWDMRLISVDALLALAKLKESTEASDTSRKIRSILAPMEYTRLDALVDVMFTAARDVETSIDAAKPLEPTPVDEHGAAAGTGWQFTDPEQLDIVRLRILDSLAKREGVTFVKRSRALYWDSSHTVRAVCTVSKRYTKKGATPYWYAYHPSWDVFLGEGNRAWFVLGCLELDRAFAIPLAVMRSQLEKLNTTVKPDGAHYWHVKLLETHPNAFALQLPQEAGQLSVEEYAIRLHS